ncbi:Emopamil-binding protein [Radiomyces spectabilis]|uniref:Emopamil-binding protein n=1 Tax=Radiomyces spectabilis TaxID=64574 RepID=UPI0022202D59|nr:Emopamil-binding protein [Radiomyces spectabilis]KAI8364791.1 Emopamil-binding protein [Radiomyces spectabilis]
MHHPYYPLTLDIPHYVANETPRFQLVASVLLVIGSIVASAFSLAKKNKRILSSSEALRFTWFVLCACLHCGLEAYWITHRHRVPARSDFLAEVWKEYAHGDSRYVTADPLLIAIETLTVFIWGPLCIITAYCIWQSLPLQYLYQLIASIAHLFSTSLYFVMDIPEGFKNCDPHPVYFWIYFVAFNAPWLVIPIVLLSQSIKRISQSLNETSKKVN